ncbi:MAG TPA: putative toxin-antitoxin system toxin component, PIN family [Terriglobales bacterium]|nr:putative toxin-antitoxin system toxin component, PIN family [Terriglobales bacterium]
MSRIVVDTNVFVSAVIFPLSIPRQAVNLVLEHGLLLLSEPTYEELIRVLRRAKLDGYVSPERREAFVGQLGSVAEFVPIIQLVRECRDPKDDKFLEVALNGRADAIITGDTDLLAMHSWRGIAILSPIDYPNS